MSDTLARWTAPERYRPGAPLSGTLIFQSLAVGGAVLAGGTAVAAAYAGVTQEVHLPAWFGPWPIRQPGALTGWVMTGIVLLGALCALWTWLITNLLRRPPDGSGTVSHQRSGTTWSWPRARVRTVAGIGAVWSIPFLLSGPMGSLDVQSYAAVGRLAALGLDPYHATPGLLGDRFSEAVDPLWRWTPTPYGPLQVQLLRGVALVGGPHLGVTVLLIRAVAILGALAALALTLRAAWPRERVIVLAVTALNPVVLLHVVSGAHLDVLVGALALLVVGLSRRGFPVPAVVLAVVACAVKLPGSVLVAFVVLDVLRRTSGPERRRALLQTAAAGLGVAAAIVALCPDPFGWVPALNVPGIVRNGTAPSTWAAYLSAALTGHLSGPGLDFAFTVGRTTMGLLGFGGIVLLLWRATSGTTRRAMHGVGWALILLAVTGPSLYPWYLTWGLFAAAVGSGPRGRLGLVALSSATCVAAALGPGGWVLALWLAVLAAVLGFTVWSGRAVLARRLGGTPPAVAVPMGVSAAQPRPIGDHRNDVPAR